MQLDFENITTRLIFASLFSYNIFAPTDTGYFGTEALLNPLLHLWSLGVEIQFYLTWPIILFVVRNKPTKIQIITIVAVVLVSFVIAQILVIKDPDVAYYSFPTRLWQFGVGALSAIAATRMRLELTPLSSSTMQLGSLAIIGGFAWLAPSSLPWPGLYAIIPVSACAVLLVVGKQPVISAANLLNRSPIRFLGVISYSLYLVHWPVVVYGNMLIDDFAASQLVRTAGVAISIALACLFLSHD